MIFLSVGSQMPFDRLVKAVDAWAQFRQPRIEILAQIGDSSYQPVALESVKTLSPAEFGARLDACSLFVAHAGMGSVLSGLERGKPMLLLPRLGALRETRNDHQVATLRWLSGIQGIYAADDETAIPAFLDRFMDAALPALPAPDHLAQTASQLRLQSALRDFIAQA
ncbi:glycosyltransferase [Roseateles violae]|uniref:Glycosyltransferase n=1 Tax=Roseateles violae TaxID=3058042 RepID=A0ABT8DWP2_9BURK|nr:glycosyltransferase [Pelomonas sp. PFR6]MDN3920852.1 glycosyltransferase [Pelomonas sp. PFR6]